MEKKKLRNSKKYHHVVSNSSPYFMTTPSKRHVKYFSDFEISKLIVKPDIKEKNNDIESRSNLSLTSKQYNKKSSIILIDLFASSSESIDSSLSSTYSYHTDRELKRRTYTTNKSIFSKILSNESIIICILSNLPLNDIISCMRVNKTWYKAAKNKEVWRRLLENYKKRLKTNNSKNIDLWESVNFDYSYEISKKDSYTTLNELVLRLTPYKTIPDQFETKALLTTYRSFTTTEKLILKLLERYNVPDYKASSELEYELWKKEILHPIRARTISILKSLIAMKYKDFSPRVVGLVKIITFFVDDSYSTILKNQIIKEKNQLSNNPSKRREKKKRLTLSYYDITSSNLYNNKFLFTYSAQAIAKELTLIEFDTFIKILPSELLNQSWSKSKKDKLSPNVREMIDRFNYYTKAISTSILINDKAKLRCKIFTKWIKIAINLEYLQNYHTLMAVLMGLGDASIYRLKSLKKMVKPKYLQALEEMNKLMSPENSYQAYRKVLANTKPPCIPYIGIYLRDLTYIESTPFIKNRNGEHEIRFNKSLRLYGVIEMIKNYQDSSYIFPSVKPLNRMLHEMPIMTDEECFERSLLIEPKQKSLNN